MALKLDLDKYLLPFYQECSLDQKLVSGGHLPADLEMGMDKEMYHIAVVQKLKFAH